MIGIGIILQQVVFGIETGLNNKRRLKMAFEGETEEDKLFRMLRRPTIQQVLDKAVKEGAFSPAWGALTGINAPSQISYLYVDPSFIEKHGYSNDEFRKGAAKILFKNALQGRNSPW